MSDELREEQFVSASEVPEEAEVVDVLGATAAELKRLNNELEVPNYEAAMQQPISMINDCFNNPLGRTGQIGMFCPQCDSKLAWEANGSTAWCPNEKCGWDTDTVRLVESVRRKGTADAANQIVSLSHSNPALITGEEPGCYFSTTGKTRTFIPKLVSDRMLEEDDIIRVKSERGSLLMIYKDGVWKDGAQELKDEIARRLHTEERENRVREVIFSLERFATKVDVNDLNKEPENINCINGVVDGETGELLGFKPENFYTVQLPIIYNPEADTTQVEGFLGKIIADEDKERFQMFMGYALTCDVRIKAFYVWLGEANTGKTTVLKLLKNILGPFNWVSVEMCDLGGNRFASAKLENKVLSLFDDIEANFIESTAALKSLTGGDNVLNVERKCENGYSTKLYAKLLFSANRIPTVNDKSSAFIDRLQIFKFDKVIKPEARDPFIDAKLSDKKFLEGALRYAVLGLGKLIRSKYQYPITPAMLKAKRKYVESNDSVLAYANQFLESTPEEENAYISRALIYQRYCEFCKVSRMHPVSKSEFQARLLTHTGSGPVRTKETIVYKNFRWNEIATRELVLEMEHFK